MAGRGEPIQIVIPKVLHSASIRQAGAVPDAVIVVRGLVDRGPGGPQLVQNLGDLRSGIIPEPLCQLFSSL
jgi:hypothetical protein